MNFTQFEYEIDRWVYIGEVEDFSSLTDENIKVFGPVANNGPIVYQNHPMKRFVTVLDRFKHHYTLEHMCKIREDWTTLDGVPCAEERIVTEAAVVALMNRRVKKEG